MKLANYYRRMSECVRALTSIKLMNLVEREQSRCEMLFAILETRKMEQILPFFLS